MYDFASNTEKYKDAKMACDAVNVINELIAKYLKAETDATNLTGWLAEESAKHQWVSVKERMPDFEGSLLCMRKSILHPGTRYQAILYYDEEGFRGDNDIYIEDGNVTHWMPLPMPPMDE